MIKSHEFDTNKLLRTGKQLEDVINEYIRENDIWLKDIVSISYKNPYTVVMFYLAEC